MNRIKTLSKRTIIGFTIVFILLLVGISSFVSWGLEKAPEVTGEASNSSDYAHAIKASLRLQKAVSDELNELCPVNEFVEAKEVVNEDSLDTTHFERMEASIEGDKNLWSINLESSFTFQDENCRVTPQQGYEIMEKATQEWQPLITLYDETKDPELKVAEGQQKAFNMDVEFLTKEYEPAITFGTNANREYDYETGEVTPATVDGFYLSIFDAFEASPKAVPVKLK